MTPARCFAANFRALLAARGLPAEPDKIVNLLRQHNGGICLTDGTVACWLWGNKLPRYSTLEMLAQWLDCDKSALLPAEHWGLLKGCPDSLKQ